MKLQLTPHEARIIGVLIEKETTTPDQYPLSLNALINACNQRSNRDPVLDLDEATVQQALDSLAKRYLVSKASGFSNRVIKYQHRFCNTEYGELKLTDRELAILCELLLRGPQTPGELRTRAERMCPFSDVDEVEAALQGLMNRDEPLVRKLPRDPGKRESRYMHQFFGDAALTSAASSVGVVSESVPMDRDRLEQLEQAVHDLAAELERVKQALASMQQDAHTD